MTRGYHRVTRMTALVMRETPESATRNLASGASRVWGGAAPAPRLHARSRSTLVEASKAFPQPQLTWLLAACATAWQKDCVYEGKYCTPDIRPQILYTIVCSVWVIVLSDRHAPHLSGPVSFSEPCACLLTLRSRLDSLRELKQPSTGHHRRSPSETISSSTGVPP